MWDIVISGLNIIVSQEFKKFDTEFLVTKVYKERDTEKSL